jgi:hypothetical protein
MGHGLGYREIWFWGVDSGEGRVGGGFSERTGGPSFLGMKFFSYDASVTSMLRARGSGLIGIGLGGVGKWGRSLTNCRKGEEGVARPALSRSLSLSFRFFGLF